MSLSNSSLNGLRQYDKFKYLDILFLAKIFDL